jgi:hypothetical protein
MTEYIGEDYGDDPDGNKGTAPGEGKNDAPATTGTHRGWGDPQAGEAHKDDADDESD